MFKRIVLEDWQHYVPLVSFTVSFGIFAYAVVRALLLKKEKVERLSQLPLEDSPQPSSDPTPKS